MCCCCFLRFFFFFFFFFFFWGGGEFQWVGRSVYFSRLCAFGCSVAIQQTGG